jgi:hypothetical protein
VAECVLEFDGSFDHLVELLDQLIGLPSTSNDAQHIGRGYMETIPEFLLSKYAVPSLGTTAVDYREIGHGALHRRPSFVVGTDEQDVPVCADLEVAKQISDDAERGCVTNLPRDLKPVAKKSPPA